MKKSKGSQNTLKKSKYPELNITKQKIIDRETQKKVLAQKIKIQSNKRVPTPPLFDDDDVKKLKFEITPSNIQNPTPIVQNNSSCTLSQLVSVDENGVPTYSLFSPDNWTNPENDRALASLPIPPPNEFEDKILPIFTGDQASASTHSLPLLSNSDIADFEAADFQTAPSDPADTNNYELCTPVENIQSDVPNTYMVNESLQGHLELPESSQVNFPLYYIVNGTTSQIVDGTIHNIVSAQNISQNMSHQNNIDIEMPASPMCYVEDIKANVKKNLNFMQVKAKELENQKSCIKKQIDETKILLTKLESKEEEIENKLKTYSNLINNISNFKFN